MLKLFTSWIILLSLAPTRKIRKIKRMRIKRITTTTTRVVEKWKRKK